MRLRASNPTFAGLALLLVAGPALAAKKRPPAPPAPPRPTVDGNAGAWVPADAYPPEAVAAGAEGRTGFTLDVDATGKVSGCRIVLSSGSTVLDEATCQLLRANAHFKPARDAKKQPVASTFSSAVRWVLPTPAPAPANGAAPQ